MEMKFPQTGEMYLNQLLRRQSADFYLRLFQIGMTMLKLACEQAPGGASAEQTFGAKRRAIGACTHSPKSTMSASKIWTQSDDWWILIIHDVVLVFTSGIDKNQNGERREDNKLPHI